MGSGLTSISWASSQARGALPCSIMMGKLPLGVVSPYVKMSSGGCSDPLKFYATSYCTAYGEDSSLSVLPSGPWVGRGTRRGTPSRSIFTDSDLPHRGALFPEPKDSHYHAGLVWLFPSLVLSLKCVCHMVPVTHDIGFVSWHHSSPRARPTQLSSPGFLGVPLA